MDDVLLILLYAYTYKFHINVLSSDGMFVAINPMKHKAKLNNSFLLSNTGIMFFATA